MLLRKIPSQYRLWSSPSRSGFLSHHDFDSVFARSRATLPVAAFSGMPAQCATESKCLRMTPPCDSYTGPYSRGHFSRLLRSLSVKICGTQPELSLVLKEQDFLDETYDTRTRRVTHGTNRHSWGRRSSRN